MADNVERKTELLTVQVTPTFNKMLQARAAEVDRSVASFIRYHVGRAMGLYLEEGEELVEAQEGLSA